ncbi:bifunctional riboflavin kinase/FAD synthetase [Polyangium sorediatum]|uniref:Riboflavin biosynthesis protein n=1 Tax=Polyangium sorediatum TaxID=889274 RepID=A0ABT6NM18_9BACT|nr:bifunctional riboflavin kinase/FAD synthetase [Polyangium sorediatum]MDI1429355.1 bifunctional riboflavin kinase/FAD synthetase [Polyangium sorediatum]
MDRQSGSQRGETSGRTGTLVVIGNFDGLHRGHRAVLAEAARIAHERGLAPVVLTFDPHPAEVLGRKAPPLLTPLARKIALCERAVPGLRVAAAPFDRAFAAQSPREFAERVLGDLGARVVMVGQNFRFGAQRAGDFAELERLGKVLGFETRSHALVGDTHGPWSSTRAREAIARGDLDEAQRILGRWHALSGTVVAGDQRGRTIGFPTANILDAPEALPPLGVYAVLIDRLSSEGAGERGVTMLGRGVANLGVRPTVDPTAARPRLEVHVFDRNEDLYGARLRVHLVRHLRPEQRFSGLDALKAQIARDAEEARRALEGITPDPEAGSAWA